jgi:phosphopantothenoylcysteine decarboxylase / phosphopantothenate---cysteine ligase
MMMKKKAKTIIIGITGSVAAYKIPQMAGDLKKQGFELYCVLTGNAQKFVTPWTMEAVTGSPAFSDMFYLKSESLYPHIELSRKADILVVAPATANFIAKAACGIADDLLTSLFLTCTCPRVIAPAMNERMYLKEQTRKNIRRLQKLGVRFMPVTRGRLSCGEEGMGRMSEPQDIIKTITSLLKKNG